MNIQTVKLNDLVTEGLQVRCSTNKDGFTGMSEGAAKPSRPENMDKARYKAVEAAYADGFRDGCAEREDQQAEAASLFLSGTNRTGQVPEAVFNYVIGNPPFVGHQYRSKDQAELLMRLPMMWVIPQSRSAV